MAAVTANPSCNRTRYGKRRKPGLRHMAHHLNPGYGACRSGPISSNVEAEKDPKCPFCQFSSHKNQ